MNINKNTPAGKGVRTGFQAVIGVVIGLFTAVWAVDGVPEVVIAYVRDNWFIIALAFGIPSGIVAWIQNRLGK